MARIVLCCGVGLHELHCTPYMQFFQPCNFSNHKAKHVYCVQAYSSHFCLLVAYAESSFSCKKLQLAEHIQISNHSPNAIFSLSPVFFFTFLSILLSLCLMFLLLLPLPLLPNQFLSHHHSITILSLSISIRQLFLDLHIVLNLLSVYSSFFFSYSSSKRSSSLLHSPSWKAIAMNFQRCYHVLHPDVFCQRSPMTPNMCADPTGVSRHDSRAALGMQRSGDGRFYGSFNALKCSM